MNLRAWLVAIGVSGLSMTACASTSTTEEAPDSGVCAATPEPQRLAVSCTVTLSAPPLEAVRHVPEGTALTYCSNPPSSGEHYPIWAAFQEYTEPVDWPYLVHDEEHGGILLLYKCDPPGCPDIVDQLRKVRDDAAADPECEDGVKRIVIAPSRTIAMRVAAAAWGFTYQADCADGPTLDEFVKAHYRRGPEDLCSEGRTFP